jgi:hypothetical protein
VATITATGFDRVEEPEVAERFAAVVSDERAAQR